MPDVNETAVKSMTASDLPQTFPVRLASRPNLISRTGQIAARKASGPQQYESLLEKFFYFRLEVDPSVKSFQSQPFKLEFDHLGKAHRAFPDVQVWSSTGTTVIDIKPMAELLKPDVYKKRLMIKQALLGQGLSYRVVTESTIFAEPRYTNVMTLCRYRWYELPQQVVALGKEFLSASSNRAAGELIDEVSQVEIKEPAHFALALISRGFFKFDLNCPLDRELRLGRQVQHV